MKEKRFRCSDESLNVYGFWVKTSGIILDDFLENPICLWNHIQGWRGSTEDVLPIGYWKDLTVENGEMIAVPVFDMDDAFAAKIGNKVNNGTLRAVSIGIRIVEWSDDPALMKPGQTGPTVTKCRLREISIVDIPANKLGVVLYDADGKAVDMTDMEQGMRAVFGGYQPGPQLLKGSQGEFNIDNNFDFMDTKLLAVLIGLSETATAADIQAKVKSLNDAKQLAEAKVYGLEMQLAELKKAQQAAQGEQVKSLLDAAEKDNRITAATRSSFARLFDLDFEAAKAALDNTKAVPKLSEATQPGASGAAGTGLTHNGKTFAELSRENPDALAALKDTNLTLFKQLYKSQYGVDYK